jgi:hypothetical protein
MPGIRGPGRAGPGRAGHNCGGAGGPSRRIGAGLPLSGPDAIRPVEGSARRSVRRPAALHSGPGRAVAYESLRIDIGMCLTSERGGGGDARRTPVLATFRIPILLEPTSPNPTPPPFLRLQFRLPLLAPPCCWDRILAAIEDRSNAAAPRSHGSQVYTGTDRRPGASAATRTPLPRRDKLPGREPARWAQRALLHRHSHTPCGLP